MRSLAHIGLLWHLASKGGPKGARALSKAYPEGRDAIQSMINDLREDGLIITVTNRKSNGSYGRSIEVTEAGMHALGGRTSLTRGMSSQVGHSLEEQRNKQLVPNSNFFNKLTESTGGAREEENYLKVELSVGGEMSDFPEAYDPDDVDGARRRYYKKRNEEKIERLERREEKRRMDKASRDPVKWSATDSAYEFARRMWNLWHVSTWEVTSSRFIYALQDCRDRYGTTGADELLMYERFFDKISHETRLNNPEIIWKMFIKQFQTLLADVKVAEVTESDTVVAVQQAKTSLDKLKKLSEWGDDV